MVSSSGGTNETGSFTDPRDGKTYKTVKIGNQWWMSENLAYLPAVYPPSSGSYTEQRYYIDDYNGTDLAVAKSNTNYTTYGVLYNWLAAKSACPSGWHLPSNIEWSALITFLGGEGIAGGKLKEAGFSHWYSPNTGATNETGFMALPAGFRDNRGTFFLIGYNGSWWSSSEASSSNVWGRGVGNGSSELYSQDYPKEYGLSIRCVKD